MKERAVVFPHSSDSFIIENIHFQSGLKKKKTNKSSNIYIPEYGIEMKIFRFTDLV